MGIVERKERERQEKRQLIISTASKLFAEHGIEKTSMRSIAEAIEYSPATIYLYFKDKNELLDAISTEGFSLFFDYLNQVPKEGEPMHNIELLGEAYLRFALEHPDYYLLMFVDHQPMDADKNQEAWDIGMRSHCHLQDHVKACQQAGYFAGTDPQATAHMIWSFIHGLVSLKISCRMRMYPEQERDQILKATLQVFNQMLAKS